MRKDPSLRPAIRDRDGRSSAVRQASPTVLSLFCGAGGLDLGLIQAGLNVVWANDIDPDSVATYQRNISGHIVCEDIAGIKTSDIPSCDMVVGGFPCQGYSMANLKRSGGDSRNSLYLQFSRVLRKKQPAYFIAENVRGILSLAAGHALASVLRGFGAAGYRVRWATLNAADYGVPQTRRRVIFLGTRKDIPEDLDMQFPIPTHARTPGPSQARWVSISEALSGIPDPDKNHSLLNHVCSQYKVTNRNFTGHRTTDGTKPSPTILARGNGKGGVCALQHPLNHRRLSVRESALVQTFPLSFEFVGRLNSMYRQVGNAVPVLLARRLGEEAMRVFDWQRTL